MSNKGFKSFDPSIAKSLNFIMDKNLKYMTEFVWRCYSDVDLLRNYEGLRKAYSVEDNKKSKSAAREVLRPPHPIVYSFIDAEMTKKYGPLWAQDKQTFIKACKKEELLHPWLVVPRNKI